MKILDEQERILDNLVCERLSKSKENESLIQSFENKRGSSLVSYFKKYGLEEDRDGKTIYYIIKTKEKEVLMFFSLKCGALFEPLQDENEIKQDIQRLLILIQAIENVNKDNKEVVDEANEILMKYQVGDRILIQDFIELLINKKKNKEQFLFQLSDEKKIEDNDKIFRVLSTYSGIELVHFCTNDNLKKKWKSYHLGHTMGETLYWKFIAPKFFEVQEIVGCEYAFLFAADLSEDGSLVNYYDVSLKFQKKQDLGTNKPFYDFCCEFMCQDINLMKKNRENFFENFNPDDEDEIV